MGGEMSDIPRPPKPTNDADRIIADDWYTFGFQAGIEAERKYGHARCSRDWKAEAARRFGPIPSGGGETARLIATAYYAFEEGVKAVLSDTSTDRPDDFECEKCGATGDDPCGFDDPCDAHSSTDRGGK
jgi:hypothetical protein